MGSVAQTEAVVPNGTPAKVQAGPVVFIGSDHAAQQEESTRAAKRAGAEAVFCWDANEAQTLLTGGSHPVPRCVLVDGRMADVEAMVAWMRGEARLFPVPVVVQVPAPVDEAYLRAHAMGADDVIVAGDLSGITRRLANLSEFDPNARPPLTQGRAVVAHPLELRRRVLGRILRQAGFDVSFALDSGDLVRIAEGQAECPSILVADAGLPGDGPLAAVRQVRGRPGCEKLPVVITAPADRVGELRAEAAALGGAAVTYEAAPPDNLLFLANELLRPEVSNMRASVRLLYGTICAFRAAGTLQPVYGLTYNISREGMYVRTLDPPKPGTPVWLEMRPPHGDGVIHLRGKAVWARGLRSPGGAAPAGFGIRLDDTAAPATDREAYETGYDRLREAVETR